MYSTCIHCHRSLGTNDVIEHFPVGSTLAFDAAKGRLWVVCRRCRRWNLTPLEERWEAIDDAERLFGVSPLRSSTDNIGVAEARDGTRLIRVGAPKKRELAGWRYAAGIVRRWRTRGIPLTAAAGTASAGKFFLMTGGGGRLGDSVLAMCALTGVATALITAGAGWAERRLTSVRVAMPDGKVRPVWTTLARSSSLGVTDGAWQFHLPDGAAVTGVAALPVLRGVLTAANVTGARPSTVDAAIRLLHDGDGAASFVQRLARAADKTGLRELRLLPTPARIALEMAVHDEVEGQADAGDVRLLELEWESAEEIAAIADDMFLSPSLLTRMTALKGELRA